MGHLCFPFLSSLLILIISGGGSSYAALSPQIYWKTVLPHTPMPSFIQQLISPEVYVEEKAGTSVGVGKGGVNVNTGKGTAVDVSPDGVGVRTGKGTSVGVGQGGVGVTTGKGTAVTVGHGGVSVRTGGKGKPAVVIVRPGFSPFQYVYAAADTQEDGDPAAALFFLPKDLRAGTEMTVQFSKTTTSGATFLPRSSADAIPFSTSELPAILSRFEVAPGSTEAATMETTLLQCQEPAAAGETKRCATSLESMVDFATANLGTRNLAALATESYGGDAAGGLLRYRFTAVRKMGAGKKGLVACHPESYAYPVFFCHATTAAEVYKVSMTAAAAEVEAVVVCHTDTAGWNPKHVAFKVLGVKPGAVPVCHFVPQDHVVFVAMV
ncbi:Dehydration-responsive protein RD22 [Apostasia shenzhenica]|uniref:Dehydration-responsive protein RD22 n=1 Tax=Apostasia shenzhenica TaxID=1088818 RepID=A0A2I0AU40_9ASPA|nr:Dehydration-responsive protein RD22 [Apostasia shenzhenica]